MAVKVNALPCSVFKLKSVYSGWETGRKSSLYPVGEIIMEIKITGFGGQTNLSSNLICHERDLGQVYLTFLNLSCMGGCK